MSIRLLRVFIAVSALLVPIGVDISVAEEVDLDSLLKEAVTVHARNLEAWQQYSFRRDVHRERIDKNGEVEWSLEFSLMNTPTEDGFDEELIEIDGRAPTAEEIEEHREEARWTKHYREVLAGKVDHVLASDQVTLPAIWEASDHTYMGREIIDGVEAHRVDFAPKPAQKAPMVERLADSIEGSLWVSVEGTHLLRWKTRLSRPLKKGLIKMKALDLEVSCQPVGDHYFASEVEMASVVNIGFGDERKRNQYRYSEFKKSVAGD